MADLDRYEVTAADHLASIDEAVLSCRESFRTTEGGRADDLLAYYRCLSALREQLRSEAYRLECARRHAERERLSPPPPSLPNFLRARDRA